MRSCRCWPARSARSPRRRPTPPRWRPWRCSRRTPQARGRRTSTAFASPPICSRGCCPSSSRHSPRSRRKLAFVGRMLVVGRGPEFATARELSLKLLETCRVAAEPLTATDLAHGPVAALDSLFPVWAIAAHDASLPTVVEAVTRARAAGATVIASGSAAIGPAGRSDRDSRARRAAAAARAAPLDRARPAARLGAGAGQRPRSRPSGRARQGHARPLAPSGQYQFSLPESYRRIRATSISAVQAKIMVAVLCLDRIGLVCEPPSVVRWYIPMGGSARRLEADHSSHRDGAPAGVRRRAQ